MAFPRTFWRRTIKAAWLVACAIVLVHSLVIRNGNSQEAEFILMLALSYPLGLLAVGGCFHLLNWSPSLAPKSIFLLWLVFSLVGWFQWFVVAPVIFRKVRQKFGNRIQQSVVPKS